MATYVVAMGSTSTVQELADGMAGQHEFQPTELKLLSLSPTTSLLIVAREVANLLQDNDQNEFFSGWMIDHDRSCIHLGLDGVLSARDRHERMDLRGNEGAFLHAKWDHESLELSHDCFGLYPILSFNEPDLFVASDSLLCLAKIRSMMNLENNVNDRVHSTRAWKHGLAQSIMSTGTIVQGIEYLPPASSIRAVVSTTSNQTAHVRIERNIPEMPRFFAKPDQPYSDILVNGLREIIGTLKAIQGLDGIATELGLSGGLDSRVLLACIRHDEQGGSNLLIRSNRHPTNKKDLEVVENLAETYHFSLNQPSSHSSKALASNRERMVIDDVVRHWALSNLGLFDMMYMHAVHWNHPSIVEVGGHGAEIMKGTFSRTSLFKSAFLYRPFNYLRIRKEVKQSLRAIGVSFFSRNKMQWHHLCYKSAIQNGRTLPRNLVTLRPFLNKSLCSYGLHFPNNTLMNDLLILMDGGMASLPFDEPNKNMSSQFIRSRKEVLKGVTVPDNIPPYTVYGTMEHIHNGIPFTLLEFGKEFTQSNGDPRDAVLAKTTDVWTKIGSSTTKHLYAEAYQFAVERLSSTETYLPRAGSSASKVMSLAMTNAVTTAVKDRPHRTPVKNVQDRE